mgnify:CR=1 FL=1
MTLANLLQDFSIFDAAKIRRWGVVYRDDLLDIENSEWRESLDYVLQTQGEERVRELLRLLQEVQCRGQAQEGSGGGTNGTVEEPEETGDNLLTGDVTGATTGGGSGSLLWLVILLAILAALGLGYWGFKKLK